MELVRTAKINKLYSVFANAITRAEAAGSNKFLYIFSEKNIPDYNDEFDAWFDKYIKPYLIPVKVCYNEEGCWASSTKYLNGEVCCSARGCGNYTVTAILNDGTSINVDAWLKAHLKEYFGLEINSRQGITIYFDINGPSKGPNTFGKDIFVVVFAENGFVLPFEDDLSAVETECSNTGKGYSCIRKYIKM